MNDDNHQKNEEIKQELAELQDSDSEGNSVQIG
jgi:hypothetical protein